MYMSLCYNVANSVSSQLIRTTNNLYISTPYDAKVANIHIGFLPYPWFSYKLSVFLSKYAELFMCQTSQFCQQYS